MKLKLVAASMSLLGLISAPAFAANAETSTTTTTAAKHHHHRHHARHMTHHVAQTHEFREAAPLPPVVMVQQIDTHQIMNDEMSQNIGRARQAMPDWFNRIGVSGGVNFDAHWGNRSQGYAGENRQLLALNDAYMNIGATVNDWTKAVLGLSFSNPNGTLKGAPLNGAYSQVYGTVNQLNLEQGYVTLANYDASPLFFQVGKQYSDYGRYTIHPVSRTLTQVVTESLQTSAKLGFITQNGLHGDVYAFDNSALQVNQQHTSTIWGAALGFDQLSDQLGFDAGVGYMSNLTGVNDIAHALGNNVALNKGKYTHLVGGISAYADINSGPFSIGARYATSIQTFSPKDLSTQYQKDGSGARPWAADVTAGYGFNAGTKNQNVYLGYQTSNDAVNLALPKNRWLVGYNVDMWKYTNVGVEVAHDTAYSSGNGGQGRSSNTIGARASVKFG